MAESHEIVLHRSSIDVEQQLCDVRSRKSFDRQTFALQVVDLLRPPDATVIVFRSERLSVRHGRDWRRGLRARWVMVGIPTDASAESIALALASMPGVSAAPLLLNLAIASVAALPTGTSRDPRSGPRASN